MASQIIESYISLLIPMLAWVVFWYLISIVINRNDFVDVAWGLGFIYITFWLTINNDPLILQYIVNGLVALWGLRLAIYLFSRNRKKKEDYRYKQWRDDWGKWFYIRSFLQVYVLQTVLMLFIALPLVFVSNLQGLALNGWSAIGIICWLIGFYWQVVGDYQKGQFKKSPSNNGELMTSGLWSKSRHPNYFGEILMWWGVWLVLIPYSLGWTTVISPIVITYLLLKVSGVPMLEAKQRKHPDFEEYSKRVPAVFPRWMNN